MLDATLAHASAVLAMMRFWGWTAAIITAVVLLFDAYCYFTGRETLSAAIKEVSREHALLPYFIGLANGILIWHFWVG